ncbi:hypothetical protein [Natronoglycomyces albus]|uniref:Uncharacterized protein n=1 Tax=Natronoglycomyces albus TaxID=2811108 RepID=A0A895XR92_9ACTN|nr:hypothetical protein [Natronoglycomyces albus]QSB06043.1 hypothetical protein JQS30_03720 [Natronoglycomyces albus]
MSQQMKTGDTDSIIDSLTDEETQFLIAGLRQWQGAAVCTEELAAALEYSTTDELLSHRVRLIAQIKARRELELLDWARVLFTVETVFISHIFGAGYSWGTVSGFRDGEALILMRSIQRKARRCRSVVGDTLGTLRLKNSL